MRVAILSDIHGNLDALQAVLTDAGEVDEVWCLGDLVGYGPQPNECIALLRERGALSIAGNHDRACTGEMDTAEFNPEASEAALWTREQLAPEHQQYLQNLPEQLIAGPSGEFTLVHGSPREPVWEYLTVSVARTNFDYFQTLYCLVGHTHIPLIFERPLLDARAAGLRTLVPDESTPMTLDENRLIVNPGSVGQPRDGNPQAAYMRFESGAEERSAGRAAGTLIFRRVTYPVAAVQQKMRDAGLPSRLITRLTYGW